jgi:hypothetical protein
VESNKPKHVESNKPKHGDHEFSEVFHEIGEYLKSAPVNKDTQLKVENALYDYSYISLTESSLKSEKPSVNYKLINKKLSTLLLEERTKLVDYININRSLTFNEEPKRTNDKRQYSLNKVLKELSDDYIISVIYGRLFKIISKYDVSPDSNSAVYVFVDIGNDLVEKFYYHLYTIQKKILKDKTYKLSDWKRENGDIVTTYTNSTKAAIGGKIVS